MTFEKKTILIVEDDRDMRKLLKMYLNHNSYQIIEATSGDEGLNILNNTIPDLIICDIMMPGMDGYELRKKILRNEKLRLVPFVFLSAKGLNKDIIEGFKLFADAYISKPFDPEILKVQVNTLLEKYTEINRLVHFDPLTKLYNRRSLEIYFAQELNRVQRYKQKLSIVMLDIDHFKNINDRFGHPVGDEVLKAIAGKLLEQVREVDIIARIGGEEFIILMPETDKETAFTVANRLCINVAGMSFSQPKIKVTISIGVASAPADGNTPEELLNKVDAAMYSAKRNGRNRVEMAV